MEPLITALALDIPKGAEFVAVLALPQLKVGGTALEAVGVHLGDLPNLVPLKERIVQVPCGVASPAPTPPAPAPTPLGVAVRADHMQEALLDAAEGLTAHPAATHDLGFVVVVAQGAGGGEQHALYGFVQREQVLNAGLLLVVVELDLAVLETLKYVLGFEVQDFGHLHGGLEFDHHSGVGLVVVQHRLQIVSVDVLEYLPFLRQYANLHIFLENDIQLLDPEELIKPVQDQIPHQLHNPGGLVRIIFWHVVSQSITYDQVKILGNFLLAVHVITAFSTFLKHYFEAYGIADDVSVVMQPVVVRVREVEAFVEFL